MELNCSFRELIDRVDSVESSAISSEDKLKKSGTLIYQSSLEILNQTQALLESLLVPEAAREDTLVDASFDRFLQSVSQQSIATDFLQKYLQPQIRADRQKTATTNTCVQPLTTEEALTEFDTDITEAELVVSLAHEENVEIWISSIYQCFENNEVDALSFTELVRQSRLSRSRIFISILFEGFSLKQNSDFYDGDGIQVKIPKRLKSQK